MKSDWFGNIALTLDNKLGKEGEQTAISNTRDFSQVYNFRNQLAGIVVGSNTVLTDNPSLLTKPNYLDPDIHISHPIPIIFDRRGRVPRDAKIFDHLTWRPVIWITNQVTNPVEEGIKIISFTNLTKVIEEVQNTLREMGRNGPVMVEGGATLMRSLITNSIIQKIRIFTSNVSLHQSDVELFFSEKFDYNLISVDLISSGFERIYSISKRTK